MFCLYSVYENYIIYLIFVLQIYYASREVRDFIVNTYNETIKKVLKIVLISYKIVVINLNPFNNCL